MCDFRSFANLQIMFSHIREFANQCFHNFENLRLTMIQNRIDSCYRRILSLMHVYDVLNVVCIFYRIIL